MDEKDRPEDDLENLMQQTAERFSVQHDVLAPVSFVTQFLDDHPPHLEQAEIREVSLDVVDEALTRVTFHLESTMNASGLGKVASLGGFDFRAARGELDRWKSACQEAHGGVGPLPESERLRQVLRPPG